VAKHYPYGKKKPNCIKSRNPLFGDHNFLKKQLNHSFCNRFILYNFTKL
jgi:hypothetical protein